MDSDSTTSLGVCQCTATLGEGMFPNIYCEPPLVQLLSLLFWLHLSPLLLCRADWLLLLKNRHFQSQQPVPYHDLLKTSLAKNNTFSEGFRGKRAYYVVLHPVIVEGLQERKTNPTPHPLPGMNYFENTFTPITSHSMSKPLGVESWRSHCQPTPVSRRAWPSGPPANKQEAHAEHCSEQRALFNPSSPVTTALKYKYKPFHHFWESVCSLHSDILAKAS